MTQNIVKGIIHTIGAMIFSVLLLAFTAGCGDSSGSGKSPAERSKPVQDVKKQELYAKDLMQKLIGSWKNDQGDSLVVTDSLMTYYKSHGVEGFCEVEYKLKGLEGALPDAIRIELARPGMPCEAVAAFNEDNYITFGIPGEMPVKLVRR
ncbi:MAG: hypothetical protein CVV49_12940 [Spirochaetae bacterium HGW-Spirochaetae-5]|nr:MAG: hypothetical protein CVV49_12940 [Spirochaetae bacterium HGW-Spirochaetae-5]